ncbi:MAG: tetratricopeptide repeat protein [Acinetobacter sp.]
MLIRQLTLAIVVSLYLSTAIAHPKHHHEESSSDSEHPNYAVMLKNNHNDELRNQIVNVLLEKAYSKGDGEFLEQAEDLMKSSFNSSDTENKLLETRLAQANHNFSKAETILNDVLKKDPKNYDAILQLANIYRLQGQFNQSLKLCDQLDQQSVKLYQVGCVLQVDAMTKNISEIKPRTNELLQMAPRLNKNDQQWLGNIMLEIATRFNDPTLASQSIPLLNVDNLPNALAKSNWYISQQEYSNAIKILTPYRYHDGALYRIILSKQKLNDPLAEKDLNELTQRVQNLLDHKDHIHLREQAQFLWVSKKYDEGLHIAAKNWNMQRENDDFEVYAALALDSKNRESTEKLLNWSNETGYQNPTYIQKLKQMLKQL